MQLAFEGRLGPGRDDRNSAEEPGFGGEIAVDVACELRELGVYPVGHRAELHDGGAVYEERIRAVTLGADLLDFTVTGTCETLAFRASESGCQAVTQEESRDWTACITIHLGRLGIRQTGAGFFAGSAASGGVAGPYISESRRRVMIGTKKVLLRLECNFTVEAE